MNWVQAVSSDFGGNPPSPRSGHTAVNVGKSMVVFFGGLVERKFNSDVVVYDIENKLWFTPECTGSGADENVGPSPRAFHVAAAIDCNMFVFGGRQGGKRLGDFWMLDTETWQWSELTSYGHLPSSRDFAAASAIGNRKILLYGGWDGKKWLSDVHVLDTISLEWTELSILGSLPAPRCGHTATMVEKRLLIFGGRGGGGSMMGDLWALKGLIEEENETPGWTQLKIPGQSPSPRCGHTVTSGGHYLLLFGGHGTSGWLSRYEIYHNECIVLDRVSAQWKRLTTSNDPPPARAYHSMSSVGQRYLLFGGFDGKSTFGDLWWLAPEDDPILKRVSDTPRSNSRLNRTPSALSSKDEQDREEAPLLDLLRKLEISISPFPSRVRVPDELLDEELIELALKRSPAVSAEAAIQALRERWLVSMPASITLKELDPLLRDYKRLIIRRYQENHNSTGQTHLFFHMTDASRLRMDDVPRLLMEYKGLIPK